LSATRYQNNFNQKLKISLKNVKFLHQIDGGALGNDDESVLLRDVQTLFSVRVVGGAVAIDAQLLHQVVVLDGQRQVESLSSDLKTPRIYFPAFSENSRF
jgi:hypothetical protein